MLPQRVDVSLEVGDVSTADKLNMTAFDDDKASVPSQTHTHRTLDRKHENVEPPTQQLNVKPPNASASSRKHKLQRCSICGNLGHKSRTCHVADNSRQLPAAHARARNNLDYISDAVRQASSSPDPRVRHAAAQSLLELALPRPMRESNNKRPPSHAVAEFLPPAAVDVKRYRSMVQQLQPADDSSYVWSPTQHPKAPSLILEQLFHTGRCYIRA